MSRCIRIGLLSKHFLFAYCMHACIHTLYAQRGCLWSRAASKVRFILLSLMSRLAVLVYLPYPLICGDPTARIHKHSIQQYGNTSNNKRIKTYYYRFRQLDWISDCWVCQLRGLLSPGGAAITNDGYIHPYIRYIHEYSTHGTHGTYLIRKRTQYQ